jgi:hypothetical protein
LLSHKTKPLFSHIIIIYEFFLFKTHKIILIYIKKKSEGEKKDSIANPIILKKTNKNMQEGLEIGA